MEELSDGMPHKLSEDFGYISEKFQEDATHAEVEKIRCNMFKKYIRYEMRNNPDFIVDILMNHFLFNHSDDYRFTYRPAYMIGSLALYAHIGLKFKRRPNDDLEKEIQ